MPLPTLTPLDPTITPRTKLDYDPRHRMEWDPTQFFRDDHTPNPFALLILNQPINERAFRVLRKHGMFYCTYILRIFYMC